MPWPVKEAGTFGSNAGSKLLLFAENADAMGLRFAAIVASVMTGSAQMDMATSRIGKGSAATSPQIAQVQKLTEVTVSAQRIMSTAILEAEQDQVQATDAGTAARVALAKKYYEDTRDYYGKSNVSEVRSAFREMQSAEKEFAQQHTATLREELAAAKEKYRDDLAAYKESLREFKEAEKEFATIDKQNAAADIAITRDTVAAKKSLIESEVATTAQASAQKFAALRDLVNQEYALDVQARQNEMKGLDTTSAAYNQVYNEIRELKAKNVQELAALDRQAAEAGRLAAQKESQSWADSVKEIENVESSLTSDLLSKRRSLSASLLQVTASFLQQEIANDLKAATLLPNSAHPDRAERPEGTGAGRPGLPSAVR